MSETNESSASGPITGLKGQLVMPGCESNFSGADSVDVNLSPQHERFCREYIIDRNATKSYLRAYPGCSYNTAKNNGCVLLTNAYIANRIDELEKARLERLNVTADKIFERLAMQAFANVRDLFDERGDLIPIADLDHDTAAAIQSIEQVGTKKGTLVKVKMYDARAALELLGKSAKLNLFRENFNLNHDFAAVSDEELERLTIQKAREVLGDTA